MAKLTVCVESVKNVIKKRRENLGSHVKICAVVKANAYGFGLSEFAGYICDTVDYFAVARVGELEILRKSKIAKPVIILSPISRDADIAKAIMQSGELSVQCVWDLKKIAQIAGELETVAKVHIMVDTGMNRFGIKDLVEFKNVLNECKMLTNVDFVGLFSHFACAGDEKIVSKQNEKFEAFVREAQSQGFSPICHIASSRASMSKKYAHDMIRLGIDLFEIEGSINFVGDILGIRKLKVGEKLGYDWTFVADRDMKIAVIGIGYGDIAVRKLSNNGQVLIGGEKCNIVGNVCMDCLFADITDVDESLIDEAMLFGIQGKNGISVCEIAEKCDTISYEILTSMTGRVKREFGICKSSQENSGQENLSIQKARVPDQP